MIILIDGPDKKTLKKMRDGVIRAMETIMETIKVDGCERIRLISAEAPRTQLNRRIYIVIESGEKMNAEEKSELEVQIAHETRTSLYKIRFCKVETFKP